MALGVVIPAKAGIHTALTEDERVVAGTDGEIPRMTAGAGSLTVDGSRGNDVGGLPVNAVRTVVPASAGTTLVVAFREAP